MLQEQTVDKGTLDILSGLMDHPFLAEYWLVGGTSLALQIGHRKSIDLDLFGNGQLENEQVTELLNDLGYEHVWLNRSKSIKSLVVNGVKTDIVNYRYDWIQSGQIVDHIRLSSRADIAAMKLSAITGRGSKKDFIDLHFLLKEYTLAQMMEFYSSKFPDGSSFLVLKSLTYFEDADAQVMPEMLFPISWDSVKESILIAHRKYVANL